MSKLKDLNIIDNFMFNELIMQEDQEKSKEFVRSILEPIIQKKINKVEISGQKVIQGLDVGKRGIQMDAFVKVYRDSTGEEVTDVEIQPKPVIYDIEPNKYPGDDARRARLYHALVDSKVTKSGVKYSELSDVYVILITPYDPFGLNRMVYTVKNRCVEEPSMEYEDGNTTIFLYAYGTKEIPSQKLADVLKYIVESSEENAKKANLNNIHSMLEELKSNSKLEEAYMQSWEIEGYFTELGIQQGIQQGLQQGKCDAKDEIAINMIKANKSYDEIAEFTGLSVERINQLANKAGVVLT